MMLKKRSIDTKQGLMFDHSSLDCPTRKFISKAVVLSLIPSPEFFVGFFDPETSASSLTSILDAKSFSTTVHHFISDRKQRAHSDKFSETEHHPWDVSESKTVGLGIIDALRNEKTDKKSSNSESRMLLFGSQLKVQLPSTSQHGFVESSHTVIEFGVKNKNSQLAMAPLLSPSRYSAVPGGPMLESPPLPPMLCSSTSEMEQSEYYTCVVSHGPNPMTTHIFYICIMQNCGNGYNSMRKKIRFSTYGETDYPSDDFLAFCNACRKKLGQGKDVFMYRRNGILQS